MMSIAKVIAYHPENATVDLRTTDGATITLAYDAHMAFYGTPVVPITLTDAKGEQQIVKPGSFALLYKFNDNNIRILRMFNDDPEVLRNLPGYNTRLAHGYIQDSLLAMVQDGEALMQAPGRIVETDFNTYERKMGAWLLLKNSGDAILSNANSSSEMWMSYDGKWEVTASKYRILAADTRIEEDEDGVLHLSSGEARGSAVELAMTPQGTASLTTGAASMSLSPSEYSLSAGSLKFYGGNEFYISTGALNAVTTSTDITAITFNVTATGSATVHGNTIAVAADTTLTANAGQSITHTAPRCKFTMSEDGAVLDVEREATITIRVGDATIRVDKDGVTIVPAANKTVNIGEGASKGVLIEGTAAQALAPVFSKLIKVAE